MPYKRKGSPYYQYEFVIEGVRFRGSTGLTSRREAEAFEDRLRADELKKVKEGAYTSPAKVTVDTVLARYWVGHGCRLAWAVTVETYLARIGDHAGLARPYSTISQQDVTAFVEHWGNAARVLKNGTTRRLSGATINRMLKVWQQVHNFAEDNLEIPVTKIKWSRFSQKEAKERVRYISPEQARDLLRHLPASTAAVVAFALATGCRKNEIATLTWSRVDLDYRVVEVETKGGGTRFVNLNASALAIINGLTNNGGKVFDTCGLRKRFTAAVLATGITDFRFHDLRHTHATWLGRAGASMQIIQAALGHTQITTTARYAHVIQGDVATAVGRLPSVTDDRSDDETCKE